MTEPVLTGLDRVARGDRAVRDLLAGQRIGLLVHPASVDRRLVHAREVFKNANVDVVALFGPEHGYGGEAQDMIGVGDAREPGTGIPIHSLYGADEAALRPKAEWLEPIDALVIDLQDVGARYYTFIWTAALAFIEAAKVGVRTIVLDRPNPLGGILVEGAPQRPGYRSFVGLYDVPVRHGMTLGEICTMVADVEHIDASMLEVVRAEGWHPGTPFAATGLPWIAPSPNMPTVETAFVYPGGCLLEGTNLSEGRGTTRPFELWGAPFVDGTRLARDVSLEGASLRPTTFLPSFHKHAGKVCGGVQVHVTDRARFRPYEAYLRLLAAVWAQRSGAAWRTDEYEFVTDRPAIDLLTGGPELREALDAGRSINALLAAEREGAAAFDTKRPRWFLYDR